MTEDLRQYLKIDKLALDEELVNQASLYFKISEAYTEAAAERDLLKETLAYGDAKIEQDIRKELGDKCTEGKVKSLLTINEKHAEANGHYLDAKIKADRLAALKEAFHQRGYMLRDLAQLFISNYYGADSVKVTQNGESAVYRAKRIRRRDADVTERID